MANEDKGKNTMHDMSNLMGVKPYGNIGPGRDTEETKSVVGKLKKKKSDSLIAEGSTSKSGEEANVGKVSSAIGSFVNRK
jgi:hypothetical protein